jgi:hypothetical protein
MRIWGSATCGAMLMLASAMPAHAISHSSEFISNWDNYRTCATTPADPLETCAQADVRSPSEYYIPDGVQGTLNVTSAGVVKFRIDTISLDDDVASCDNDHKVQYGSCFHSGGVDCFASPPRIGTCTLSGTDQCCNDAACLLPGCDGGPHQDARCTSVSTCKSTAGATFKLVFRGVGNSLTTIPGFFPWQYYKMLGDDPTDANDGVGCTKTCSFTLASGNPQYNSSDMTSSCTTDGDCGSGGPTNFSTVEIIGPDEEVLAIPTRGTAKLQTNPYVVYGDPAQVGDYCRTQGSPPANCP